VSFETRLPTPKYNSIWDVSLVLRHLSKSYPNVTLPLKDLTYKVLMLLLLVSGQRGQSIHLLDLKHLSKEDQRYSFDILQHTKTSRPGVSPTRIEIARYDSDTTICPLSCLQEYINRTQQFRGVETKLFISHVKPYKAVSRETISRLRPPSNCVALTLQCSLRIVQEQPLPPRLVQRTSLYTR